MAAGMGTGKERPRAGVAATAAARETRALAPRIYCLHSMDPCHISPPLPPGTSLVPDSDIPREFLRERLAYFARIHFWLCFGFYVLGNLIISLAPEQPLCGWFGPEDVFHLLATAILAGMWALTTWRHPSLSRL